MRLLFLGFSSPVAGLEATEGKVAQEWLGLEVSICGEKFPVNRQKRSLTPVIDCCAYAQSW